MKFRMSFAAVATLAMAGGMVFSSEANAVNIPDQYIGGVPTNPAWVGDDVIGNTDPFEIYSADVTKSGNDLIVRINTEYAGAPGTGKALDTVYGDLFFGDYLGPASDAIFTNTNTDKYTGDEGRFTYVVDNWDGTGPVTDPTLHALETGANAGNDVQTSFVNVSGGYRTQQAVEYTGSGPSIGSGHTFTVNTTENYIEYTLKGFLTPGTTLYNTLSPEDGFIFAWAMTCANDVIYGFAQERGEIITTIPLPSGIVLLLSGLLGVGFLARRRVRGTMAQ